jgi:hypothetical protein
VFTETFDAAAEVGRAASRIRLLSYPEEEVRRAQLAAEGKPRMLVVAPGCPPPTLLDQLEDWVRSPITADELDARLAELERRAELHPTVPCVLFVDGIVRVADRWTTIPAAQ